MGINNDEISFAKWIICHWTALYQIQDHHSSQCSTWRWKSFKRINPGSLIRIPHLRFQWATIIKFQLTASASKFPCKMQSMYSLCFLNVTVLWWVNQILELKKLFNSGWWGCKFKMDSELDGKGICYKVWYYGSLEGIRHLFFISYKPCICGPSGAVVTIMCTLWVRWMTLNSEMYCKASEHSSHSNSSLLDEIQYTVDWFQHGWNSANCLHPARLLSSLDRSFIWWPIIHMSHRDLFHVEMVKLPVYLWLL